jgi:hypothetical protein
MLTDFRTPIDEQELTALVHRTLHEAGYTWVQSVTLEWKALQIPNWRILRFSGSEPAPGHGVRMLSHPAVKDLQKEYALLGPAR